MYRGNIDIAERFDDKKLLIIDCELLFDIIKVPFFRFWKSDKMRFTDFNRKVMRYISKIEKKYDDVLVIVSKNKKQSENILKNVLMNRFNYMFIDGEENYEIWLKIVRPTTHLTINKRRYFLKSSVLIDDLFLNNFVE